MRTAGLAWARRQGAPPRRGPVQGRGSGGGGAVCAPLRGPGGCGQRRPFPRAAGDSEKPQSRGPDSPGRVHHGKAGGSHAHAWNTLQRAPEPWGAEPCEHSGQFLVGARPVSGAQEVAGIRVLWQKHKAEPPREDGGAALTWPCREL